jgi:hypothetical protein
MEEKARGSAWIRSHQADQRRGCGVLLRGRRRRGRGRGGGERRGGGRRRGRPEATGWPGPGAERGVVAGVTPHFSEPAYFQTSENFEPTKTFYLALVIECRLDSCLA